MAKGNGGTRAGNSGNPKGFSAAAQQPPTINRISDIAADQLGYGGLTRDNSTYTKKERDAYIEANINESEIKSAASNSMDSIVHIGDILVQMDKGTPNEFGNRKVTYILSDTYGHTEQVTGWDSKAVADVRRGMEKFLKLWPQKK